MEVKEKARKIEQLEKKNGSMAVAANPDFVKKYDAVCAERDRYKQQIKEMTEFLADYGLKWVGKDGPQEGKFHASQVMNELDFNPPQY